MNNIWVHEQVAKRIANVCFAFFICKIRALQGRKLL